MLISRNGGGSTFNNDVEILPGSGPFVTFNNSNGTNTLHTWGNLRVGGGITVGVNKNQANSSPNTVGFSSVTLTGGSSAPTVFAPNTPAYANVGAATANMTLANIGEAA